METTPNERNLTTETPIFSPVPPSYLADGEPFLNMVQWFETYGT